MCRCFDGCYEETCVCMSYDKKKCMKECRCECAQIKLFEKAKNPGCFSTKEEIQRKLDSLTCKLCCVSAMTVKMLPCQHSFCGKCSLQIIHEHKKVCTVCKESIDSYQRIGFGVVSF